LIIVAAMAGGAEIFVHRAPLINLGVRRFGSCVHEWSRTEPASKSQQRHADRHLFLPFQGRAVRGMISLCHGACSVRTDANRFFLVVKTQKGPSMRFLDSIFGSLLKPIDRRAFQPLLTGTTLMPTTSRSRAGIIW